MPVRLYLSHRIMPKLFFEQALAEVVAHVSDLSRHPGTGKIKLRFVTYAHHQAVAKKPFSQLF